MLKKTPQTPLEKIIKYNYCYVDNCMMPRYNLIFCRDHAYTNPNKKYVDEINSFFNSNVPLISKNRKGNEDINNKFKTKQIISEVDESLGRYLNMVGHGNYKSVLDIYNFYIDQRKKYMNKNNICNTDVSYKQIIDHNYDIYNNDFCNDNILHNCMVEISRDKFYNKKNRLYGSTRSKIKCECKKICSDIHKGYKSDKKVDVNYNEKLYTEFIKLINKYDIIYYKKEKTFHDLVVESKIMSTFKSEFDLNPNMSVDTAIELITKLKSKRKPKYNPELSLFYLRQKGTRMRYDLYGIMMLDTQLFYFLIELDEDHHFGNNDDVIKRDIKKEIYAWNNCMSILRIYHKDNIYEQIDSFLNDIKSHRKPIIKYSNIEKYIYRNKRYDSIIAADRHD